MLYIFTDLCFACTLCLLPAALAAAPLPLPLLPPAASPAYVKAILSYSIHGRRGNHTTDVIPEKTFFSLILRVERKQTLKIDFFQTSVRFSPDRHVTFFLLENDVRS